MLSLNWLYLKSFIFGTNLSEENKSFCCFAVRCWWFLCCCKAWILNLLLTPGIKKITRIKGAAEWSSSLMFSLVSGVLDSLILRSWP